MTQRTEPTADPIEVVITRVFDAPRALVFKAWTDPAMVTRWWGPHGFTNALCDLDVRPGGAIRIEMCAPDGTVYPMSGEYHEIVDPERLVFTSVALDAEGRPMIEALNTVTFAEHGGGTMLTLTARVLAATADAAPHLAGMNEGWTQSIDRLEAFVASAGDAAERATIAAGEPGERSAR